MIRTAGVITSTGSLYGASTILVGNGFHNEKIITAAYSDVHIGIGRRQLCRDVFDCCSLTFSVLGSPYGPANDADLTYSLAGAVGNYRKYINRGFLFTTGGFPRWEGTIDCDSMGAIEGAFANEGIIVALGQPSNAPYPVAYKTTTVDFILTRDIGFHSCVSGGILRLTQNNTEEYTGPRRKVNFCTDIFQITKPDTKTYQPVVVENHNSWEDAGIEKFSLTQDEWEKLLSLIRTS